jgi:arylsulfatase A
MLRLSLLAFIVLLLGVYLQPVHADEPPNLVILFADDLGYRDLGCFGAPKIKTPHIDRLADEGMRFTDFLVGQATCSPSRYTLLTGCYPTRLGIIYPLGPSLHFGIADRELTLAEMVKSRGYATAIFGKWHLGHDLRFLPTRHGFDEYFGLPYSNDMFAPVKIGDKSYETLPLMEGEKVVATNPDQSQLTTWYTERAVKFIEQHRDRPFFLYVPYAMPHVPLAVSDKHQGKSAQGLYGDAVEEIDWSVGQILEALKRFGLEKNTWVIFTSDNGPWLPFGNHGGSALPLREGKATTFEGGFRMPCVMRWPAVIPAGTECNQLAATMDILPTMAEILKINLPQDRIIDGKSILPLMKNLPGAKSPHQTYYYYYHWQLQAVRSGKWKLHLPHEYRTLAGKTPGNDGKCIPEEFHKIGLALFDLDSDVGETTNVAEQHPQVVERLLSYAEQAREDLGDQLTKRKGKNIRPPDRVEKNKKQ